MHHVLLDNILAIPETQLKVLVYEKTRLEILKQKHEAQCVQPAGSHNHQSINQSEQWWLHCRKKDKDFFSFCIYSSFTHMRFNQPWYKKTSAGDQL
jgi:membrane-anchored protein YejM (alkaline phosphatase superfamily)